MSRPIYPPTALLQLAEQRLAQAERQLWAGQQLLHRLTDPNTPTADRRAIDRDLARQCALVRDTLHDAIDMARRGGGL